MKQGAQSDNDSPIPSCKDYEKKSLEYEVLQIRYILCKYIHDNKNDLSSWVKEATTCAIDFNGFVAKSSLTYDNLKRYVTQTMAPTFTSYLKSRLGLIGTSTLRHSLELRAASFPSSNMVVDKYRAANKSGKNELISTLYSDIASVVLLLEGVSEEVEATKYHPNKSSKIKHN